MFCVKCGNELKEDDSFCSKCGTKKQIIVEPEGAVTTKTCKLNCQDCGGEMDFDETKKVIACPFCGSKKIIVESDKVKVAQIVKEQTLEKSQIIKEQNLERAKMREETKQMRIKSEEERFKEQLKEDRIHNYRKGGLCKTTFILAFIFGAIGAAAYYSHYYLCGTIGIIQALLFFSSWVVGMNSSTTKRQAVAIILFVLGVGLTAPFCLLMV